MSSWKFEQKIIDSHVEHSTIFHNSESIEMKPIVFPASEFALMKNFRIVHCVSVCVPVIPYHWAFIYVC